MNIQPIFKTLIRQLEPLRFSMPVACVYNPLLYARKPFNMYLDRYGLGKKEILLIGMNPGPFGMAQTGVPFGDTKMVKGFLGIEAPVSKPVLEHPKRPVDGFACRRSEVSGSRLWGWARDRYGSPERFFARFFVHNFCPLVFMEESGANRTPDKLPSEEKKPLMAACNQALRSIVEQMEPRYVIGIGGFAEKQAHEALEGMDIIIGKIPHPSPANPAANKGWAQAAEAALKKIGILL